MMNSKKELHMSLMFFCTMHLKDMQTGKIIEKVEVFSDKLKCPHSLDHLGLCHKDQIKLIGQSQDFLLRHQIWTLPAIKFCPHCNKKVLKQGILTSVLHGVFSDHRVSMQKLICGCGWQNKATVHGVYGASSHPELTKIQAFVGANASYRQGSNYLNTVCARVRKINNHHNLRRVVNKIGSKLEEYKKLSPGNPKEAAKEILICVDGGHVLSKEVGRQSFEEMVSTCYNLDDRILCPDKKHRIIKKICVASAKSDYQVSIKALTKNACEQLGLSQETKVTALSDGAKNCWSITNSIAPFCKEVTKILDWYHIRKKFQECEDRVSPRWKKRIRMEKWHLWMGYQKKTMIGLNFIRAQLRNRIAVNKVNELIKYLGNNQLNLTNYRKKQEQGLPFSSQLAETSVYSIINQRQKHQRMQWTRKGANNIIQIRTSIFSKTWNRDWSQVKNQVFNTRA